MVRRRMRVKRRVKIVMTKNRDLCRTMKSCSGTFRLGDIYFIICVFIVLNVLGAVADKTERFVDGQDYHVTALVDSEGRSLFSVVFAAYSIV